MRYIDAELVEKQYPKGWLVRAGKAENCLIAINDNAIAAATDSERRMFIKQRVELIRRKSMLWTQLKACLAQLSDKKCWYCESRVVRSDNAVDHYRPKGRVFESPNHPGYWWLAFKPNNYRFSCAFCNSRHTTDVIGAAKGKHDHFPLLRDSPRAMSPTDSCDDEKPILLDPVRQSDVMLLDFTIEGQPVSRRKGNGYEIPQLRAEQSIYFYHLDQADLVDERVTIYNRVKRKVNEGTRFYDHANRGDELARHALDGVMRDLKEIISPSAPHSTAARRYVRSFRVLHEWVEDVLEF